MKFGLFISYQHLVGESLVERFREHLDQVRAAKNSGFESIWAGQHYLASPFQMFQPLPVLARVAAVAENMTIGTSIMLIPLLNPVDIAEQISTMDAICEGRFIFGVGLGYRELEDQVFGLKKGKRVSRFVETLELIKRLWTEERVDFEGEHFQFRGLSLLTKPVQKPHPPIWIAADNDKATIRAARMGDSWIINPHATSATLERQMGLYREARQAEGLPMPAEIPLMRELFVSEDRQTALREAQPYLEQKYKAYREWGQDKVLPTGDHFDHSYPDLLRDRFIIGDPEDCAGQIEDYRERLGANHMIFRIQWPGMDQAKVLRTIELLGKHVIPRFKESG